MYDAIIILGGSFKNNGELMPWVIPRLDEALKHKTKWYITCSRSTIHKSPLLDTNRFPIDESTLLSDYLISKGVSEKKILRESWSLDTIGNAYGSLVFHCMPLKLEKLLVITSDFHMPRCESIFKKIFSSAPNFNFHLDFISTDSELEISDKERKSLINWNENSKKFNNIQDLHYFIFINHNAYKSGEKTIETYFKKDMEMYIGKITYK